MASTNLPDKLHLASSFLQNKHSFWAFNSDMTLIEAKKNFEEKLTALKKVVNDRFA